MSNFFNKKDNALKKIISGQILCNKNITKFFICDNYLQFLQIIKKSNKKDFYEHIFDNKPIRLFFDIEIYEYSPFFETYSDLLNTLFMQIQEYFNEQELTNLVLTKTILESHSITKKSFHIIYKIINQETKEYLFENTSQLKELWKNLNLAQFKQSDPQTNRESYIIDPSVYRTGLFRTIYSSKDETPPRPLVFSLEFHPELPSQLELESDRQLELDTFVQNIPNNFVLLPPIQEIITVQPTELFANVPEELNDNDCQFIKKFIKTKFHHLPNKIRDIKVDNDKNCIIVALNERFCHFVDREHHSNNQYIIIDTTSSKQRCHDSNCDGNYNEIKMEDYPKEINIIIKKCLKVNKQELDLIDHAIEECKSYINDNFDNSLDKIQFDKNEMLFRGNVNNKSLVHIIGGTCKECQIEHQISNTGYCMKCIICKSNFPKNQLIPIDDRYKHLNNFWNSYSQLVNNGTVNINIYNSGAEEDFNCDIKLDNSILKNNELTKMYNQVLDGHKITKFAEVLFYNNKNYVYTKNNWYFFDNSIWISDDDNLHMKKSILDCSSVLYKISQHYENKKTKENTQQIVKNIKGLVTKLNKPGFKDDIIKEAKMFYNDPKFIGKLNSKKHLLPFTDGVIDLITNQFRNTNKDDYINLTVGYPFTIEQENQEVYKFIREVLPQIGVRDYVLKKMSECLNGDIPNTNFLIFIGDTGANGKSQLLNLMNLTMGDFGEKVEVTLLTRKRNNANEANSEKIKLMNKRFAFLSEPEDGEKINIGLLKELTGSEEIVARGLYQDAVSFVMEAKLFLACNELPEIKGEDTALWRRIRAIDFPSRFIDDPKEENEYLIDRTLPSRMREDITWRQTFMKILLSYYDKKVPEPEEVKIKTNEYRQENNDFYNWIEENIEYKEGSILKLKDICELYTGKIKIHSSLKTKYKKEVEKYIKEKYHNINHVFKDSTYNGIRYSGWIDLQLTI